MHALDPTNPTLHYQSTILRNALNQISSSSSSTLAPKALDVLTSELSPLISPSTDLAKHNDEFLQQHRDSSPAHTHAGLRVRHFLETGETSSSSSSSSKTSPQSSSIQALVQDLMRTLDMEQAGLEDAQAGLSLVQEWADRKAVDEYRALARRKWPQATVFKV